MLVTLYDERTLLGEEEYEKIVQLLLWSADQVCLPPQARLRQDLPDGTARHFFTNLHELADAGLLGTYKIESAPPIEVPDRISFPEKGQRLVSRDEYLSLFSDVRESTLRYREQLTRSAASHIEGVTEYVTLQSQLWTIGLAGLVGSGQALTSDRRSMAFMQQVKKSQLAADLRAPAIDSLIQLNDIGSLQRLSVDNIMTLRRYLPQVREFLDRTINDVMSKRPLASIEELRADVADQARREYFELYRDLQMSTSQRTQSLAVDIAVTVLGYFYPALSIIAFAKPLAEWIESRHGKNRVMVFNMKLRKMTRQE